MKRKSFVTADKHFTTSDERSQAANSYSLKVFVESATALIINSSESRKNKDKFPFQFKIPQKYSVYSHIRRRKSEDSHIEEAGERKYLTY